MGAAGGLTRGWINCPTAPAGRRAVARLRSLRGMLWHCLQMTASGASRLPV
jgi:hypothetical protein